MGSPYVLPDGNVQIAFSGGRTSAYMLHHILEENGGLPDRCKVVFANTGREMPQTLDFVAEVSQRWSIKIIWVEYRNISGKHSFIEVDHSSANATGQPIIELMEYFGFTPNRAAKFCSHEGKTRTAKRYCMSVGWKKWTAAVGIRKDEDKRVIKSQQRERYSAWYPLVAAEVTKEIVSDFWAGQAFDLKLPNIKGVTPMGNCDGCFLKSEAKRAALVRDFPDRAAWWDDQEQKYGTTFVKNLSWSDMIKMVETLGPRLFSNEDYLCQANGGECTQ